MELEDEGRKISSERIPCQYCNRKFIPESLSKHAKVCEKTLHKKRNTFDSAKQRIQGTELAEFLPVIVKKDVVPVKVITPYVPRKINKVTSPISKSSNYERCPYCDRSFGPKAFDRHIEWCREQSIRINLKCTATQEAKERLEARTKYRAPCFKSRRSITREKYSQSAKVIGDKSEDKKDKDLKPYEVQTKLKMIEKSKPKEKETNFIRQNVLRCSHRGTQLKRPETKVEKDNLNITFQKKKPDYIAVQDWISANETKIKPSQSCKVTGNVNKTSIDIGYKNYNPYILAEHQMKELLNDVNVNTSHPLNQTFAITKCDIPSLPPKDDGWNNFHNKENISYDCTDPVKTISCQTDVEDKSDANTKTFLTSAFNKYTNSTETVNRAPTPIPDEYSFLPSLSNKYEKNHDINMNQYPFSLSNLSLCSSVSIDLPDDRGKCKSADKPKAEAPMLQRSISASVADKKNSIKKNLKMENLLYGSKKETPVEELISNNYDEKLEKLDNLLDGESFDLLHSFTEFENMFQNSYYDNETFSGLGETNEKKKLTLKRGDSMGSEMSIDSAYNSLNRKSPAIFDSQKFCGKLSTPETDISKSSTFSPASGFQDGNAQSKQRLSKFCHECGVRYPLDLAKFCCECGVRRLVL